jgi:hypothetical protein
MTQNGIENREGLNVVIHEKLYKFIEDCLYPSMTAEKLDGDLVKIRLRKGGVQGLLTSALLKLEMTDSRLKGLRKQHDSLHEWNAKREQAYAEYLMEIDALKAKLEVSA